MTDIHEYLRAESSKRVVGLAFLRTALIGEVSFWLWSYHDSGRRHYVDVGAVGARAVIATGAADDLTPEQYLGLRYARRWRGKKRAGTDTA